MSLELNPNYKQSLTMFTEEDNYVERKEIRNRIRKKACERKTKLGNLTIASSQKKAETGSEKKHVYETQKLGNLSLP